MPSGVVVGAGRFVLLNVLGSGAYGTVWNAWDVQEDQPVAVKHVRAPDNAGELARLLREVMLLRLLRDSVSDLVALRHVSMTPEGDLYIAMELMQSDLHTVVGANDDLMPEHHCVMMFQLLRGLARMHEAGVLHRDLKPKNLLVNSDSRLKLADLGLARAATSRGGASAPGWSDYVATRWYRAPELCGMFNAEYTAAVDVWSAGCVFAEVLERRPLFCGENAGAQLKLIVRLLGKPSAADIDAIPNPKARSFINRLPRGEPQLAQRFARFGADAVDLLCGLLEFDPAKRLTARQALAHPFFSLVPPDLRDGEGAPMVPGAIDELVAMEAVSMLHDCDELRKLLRCEVYTHYPPPGFPPPRAAAPKGAPAASPPARDGAAPPPCAPASPPPCAPASPPPCAPASPPPCAPASPPARRRRLLREATAKGQGDRKPSARQKAVRRRCSGEGKRACTRSHARNHMAFAAS